MIRKQFGHIFSKTSVPWETPTLSFRFLSCDDVAFFENRTWKPKVVDSRSNFLIYLMNYYF